MSKGLTPVEIGNILAKRITQIVFTDPPDEGQLEFAEVLAALIMPQKNSSRQTIKNTVRNYFMLQAAKSDTALMALAPTARMKKFVERIETFLKNIKQYNSGNSEPKSKMERYLYYAYRVDAGKLPQSDTFVWDLIENSKKE